MRQKGFAIIPILIVIAIVLSGVIYLGRSVWTGKTNISSPTPIPVVEPTPQLTLAPTSTPTQVATIKPTPKPATPKPATPKPTPTATPAPTAPSCNYGTNEASGAISITFNLSKGTSTYWSTVVEVKAQNGCKVLDGNSTDTIKKFKSSTSNYVTFPGLPAGTYDVRFSYHDVWNSPQTVSVSSAQQTNMTFSLDNSSDP